MSHHDTTIPLSVFDPNDEGDGEIEVSFDWSPGQAASGMSGPPEDYDPGSADDFYIVDVKMPADVAHWGPVPESEIIEWLDENWERPDYAAEEADHLYEEYRYEEYRDRMMEKDYD